MNMVVEPNFRLTGVRETTYLIDTFFPNRSKEESQ